jgi:hypothetical protein
VTSDWSGRHYTLTIQKQPGLRPGPLQVAIRVPDGASIVTGSDDLDIEGHVATMTTSFDRDIELEVVFQP